MARILRATSTRVSQGSQSNGPRRTIDKTLGQSRTKINSGWFCRRPMSIYVGTYYMQKNRESMLSESEANHTNTTETSNGYNADNEDSEAEEDAESDEGTESNEDTESNEGTESDEDTESTEGADAEEIERQNEEDIRNNNVEDYTAQMDDDSQYQNYEHNDAADITPTDYDGMLSHSESELKLYDEIDSVCMSDT